MSQEIIRYLSSREGPGAGLPAVNVNSGTWYPDNASIRYWPIQARSNLTTAVTAYEYFTQPIGGAASTGQDTTNAGTNLEAMPVPGNEAWYLWGIKTFIQTTSATPITSAQRALLQQVINGAYFQIKVPQNVNYRSTLWKFFGALQFSQADATPTLSQSQPSMAVYEATEKWPIPMVYQATSTWSLRLNLDFPVPAGITGVFNLGFELERVLVSLVPA